MLEKFLDLIFPPVCGFCGKFCKEWLCEECKVKVNANLIINEYHDKYFTKHIYLIRYVGFARSSILRYKFNRKIIYV